MTSMEMFFSFIIIFIAFNSMTSMEVPNLKKGHSEIGNYRFMDMDECGYINPKDVPQPKIVGGAQTIEGEFPWSVSIHYKNLSDSKTNDSFICGGALIHYDWVLSARHCANNVNSDQLKVYLGSVNKYQYYSIHYVSEIIRNPYWDLLLLKLSSPAYPAFMANHYVINTICLPKPNLLNSENEEAIIAGFGAIDAKNQQKSSVLLKTRVVIKPFFECLEMNLTLYYFCATESEHMTCYGDSGSALIQFDGKRAVMLGTVVGGKSFTKDICGPGIIDFTRVSFFIDWIQFFLEYPTPDQLKASTPNNARFEPSHSLDNSKQNESCLTTSSLFVALISILFYNLFV